MAQNNETFFGMLQKKKKKKKKEKKKKEAVVEEILRHMFLFQLSGVFTELIQQMLVKGVQVSLDQFIPAFFYLKVDVI